MTVLFQLAFFLLAGGVPAHAAVPTATEMDNNAYVRLYTEWVELDKNNLERMKIASLNDLSRYEMALKLVEKGNMSLEEFRDRETRYKISALSVTRQEIKIRESEARLAVVKSRVGAGLNDIPICTRPSDGFDGR